MFGISEIAADVQSLVAKGEALFARLEEMEQNVMAKLASVEQAIAKLQANPLIQSAEQMAATLAAANPTAAAAVATVTTALNDAARAASAPNRND